MLLLLGWVGGYIFKGAVRLPSYLSQRQRSIFVPIWLWWLRINPDRPIHMADVIHTVITAAPAPIPFRGSVPAAFLSVPFKPQLFQLLFVRLRVPTDPDKTTDNLYGDIVQPDQLVDQPLEFLRCFFRVAFVSFPVLVDMDPFHTLEHDLIFGV